MFPKYYWRDYTGKIPNDALYGARDVNGIKVFIGQAYKSKAGMVPVEIYPTVDEVYVPMNQVATSTKYGIKILCGYKDHFKWIPTDKDRVHRDLSNKHPVVGGYQEGAGNYGVGRTSYNGRMKIGKICLFEANIPFMYFAENGKEVKMANYEILVCTSMYKNDSCNDGFNKHAHH